jgi:uncharacterized protein (DUF2236 family)
VNREWLISLAGPRAVLLELAHPGVAAGVARHSNYQGDPFGRLYRTMKTMTEISFGTESEMRAALAHFHKCHARVRGEIVSSVSSECPMHYDARDPALQFWVLATLADSVLLVYERFVAPLSRGERHDYYNDCVKLARILGIPQTAMPVTFSEFTGYMNEMVSGEALKVTEEARKVVGALYAPTVRGHATRRFSFPSIGMLPPRLRDEFGFTWTQANERRLEQLASVSRRARKWVPHRIAIHPKAYAMEQKHVA